MWLYRRLFTSLVVCCVLLGCVFFLRLQLSDSDRRRRPTSPPDFLPNVARFRTSRVCSQRALVLVISSPPRAHRRQVIRETWAHPAVTQTLDISVAFGVGTSDNADVQRSLDWEAEIYGDIFQDPSIDNGSQKSASRVMQLLKAARSACSPLPEFVMKADDDVFVNIHSLGELLEILETYTTSNTMWCLEWSRHLDKMGHNYTWVVLRSTTPQQPSRKDEVRFHPRYCVATVYLMTGKALDAITHRNDMQTGRTLLPEDVYVTGILPKEAGTILSFLGERSALEDHPLEEVDAAKVAFAYLGDRFEDETNRLWRVLAKKEKLSDSRRYDVGL